MNRPRPQTELTRLDILRKSYKLMSVGSWDSVSVSDLEKGIDRTRGAIFYFNKNKADLFINLMDEMFFPIFTLTDEKRERYNDIDVNAFFSNYRNPFERVIDDLRHNHQLDNPEIKLFNIISQAQKFYPGFNEKLKDCIESEIKFLSGLINPQSVQLINIRQIFCLSIGNMFMNSL